LLRATIERCARLVMLALLLVARPAVAQIGLTTLEFSFSNPGARSLGLGEHLRSAGSEQYGGGHHR
jgi:hypothetical protein